MKINKQTLYGIIVALTATTLIASNLASTKLFDFFGTGLILDGGAIIFPLSYILGDVTTEIYGFKKTKRIIMIAFAMNLLTVLVLFLVQILPPAQGWDNQSAYEAVIGFMPRIVLGSLTAYVVGQILNSYIFAKIKVKTEGKKLWLRALGSSIPADLIDTLIFTIIAFYGTVSLSAFVSLCALAFATKIIGEIVLTPVTYAVVKFVKNITNDDHFDKNLKLKDVFTK